MRLLTVYPLRAGLWPFRFRPFDPHHIQVLYDLLAERQPHESISHNGMPSFKEHFDFVRSEPYEAWYLAEVGADLVGSVYLSKRDELGVSIFRKWQGRGYASEALCMLMCLHPRARFYANVNPANDKSIALFTALNFKHVQNTYAVEVQQ